MPTIKIRCPNCSWEPDGKPYWRCICGQTWNAFETAGKCPSCGRQHHITRCIASAGGCGAPSRHLAWYEGLEVIMDEIGTEALRILTNASRTSERE